jgi:MFS family permease
MCLSPLVGYMGDRYNRKLIILLGTLFWVFAVFFSSFISGPENFWWFLFTRCLVGIGEASYSCIAPTIITDMFEPERRNNAVSFFVVAIPVGSGVGFITGSQVFCFLELVKILTCL